MRGPDLVDGGIDLGTQFGGDIAALRGEKLSPYEAQSQQKEPPGAAKYIVSHHRVLVDQIAAVASLDLVPEILLRSRWIDS